VACLILQRKTDERKVKEKNRKKIREKGYA